MSEKPKYPKPYEYVEDDPAHNAVTGCLCYSCQAKRGYDPYYPPVKSSGETKPDRCPCRGSGHDHCGSVERNLNRAICFCAAEYRRLKHASAYPCCFWTGHDAPTPAPQDDAVNEAKREAAAIVLERMKCPCKMQSDGGIWHRDDCPVTVAHSIIYGGTR